MIRAPTARANDRRLRGARPGGTRHQGPRTMATRLGRCGGRCRQGVVDRARAEPAPFYRSATVARRCGPAGVSDVPRWVRATMPPMAGLGAIHRTRRLIVALAGVAARRALGRRRRRSPTAPSRPNRRRRPRSSSAGRSSRSRRSASWRPSAGGCGRSGGSTRAHPANPVPRRRTVAFLAGMLALALALLSGIDRYDTTLFSVHMVQHVLLMLVAAPLLALAAPITLHPAGQCARDAAAVGPAGPPFAGPAVPRPPGRRPGCCSRRRCGRSTSRRCSTRRSRTRSSTTSSTCCS